MAENMEEYETVAEEDLSAVSGGCGTPSNPGNYPCVICGNSFPLPAPHHIPSFSAPGGANAGGQTGVCESCYQANKDKRNFRD